MSADGSITIVCDAPECYYWDDAGTGKSPASARKALRGRGWRLGIKAPKGIQGRGFDRLLDFCPRHPNATAKDVTGR